MNAPVRHPVAVLKERPFGGRLRVLDVDWSRLPSIADVLDAQEVSAEFRAQCVCVVNDEIVPRAMWRHVRPKPCCIRAGKVMDVVVIFRLPLGDGGSGGARGGGARKNPVATVASVAVLLAATALTAGAAAPLLGAGFGASTIGASLLGAGVGLGGSLAVASLLPPPSLRANQSVISADSGTNAAASLSANTLSKGGAVPRVIGTMRIYPPIISPELIEIVGDQTVAECVFGLAGPHQISDLMVGTSTEASIPTLQTEIQEGLPNSPVLGLVTRQSFTDPSATQLLTQHLVDNSSTGGGVNLLDQTNPINSCPQWLGLTSRVAPDEIWIHLNFVGGLNKNSSTLVTAPVRVRMRQAGTSTWINLPEVHVIRLSQASFQVAIKLMFEAALPLNTSLGYYTAGGPVRAYTTVPTQTTPPVGNGGWTADSYFYAGSGDTYLSEANVNSTTGVINTNLFLDRAEFYLTGSKFPKSGNWEIQIMRAASFVESSFSGASGYIYGGTYVFDFFGWSNTGGGVSETIDDQRQYSQAIELIRFSSIWNVSPVPDPTQFAVIGAKVTNASISQLSVLASGYVKDWDGSGWNNLTVTSCPAPHYYDVLTGTLGASPLPLSIVDSAGLVNWRTLCNTQGYTCNAVVEGRTYPDVLTLIAAAGYAKPAHSELWGVCVGQNTSANAPVQVFTPRNMSGFTVSKAFNRLPTGIRADYLDSTNNYLPNEIIVFADPNNPDSSRLDQISYDGLVSLGGANGVDTRATFDILQGKLRLTFYKGTVDLESIVCQKGDLVGIQHDIFDSYGGSARIVAVDRSGGNILGLTLDGSVPVNTGTDIAAWPDLATATDMAAFGAQTGLRIRYGGGQGIATAQQIIGNGDLTSVTFATPFADPGTYVDDEGVTHNLIDVGCLCTVGYVGIEYRRFNVFSITPSTGKGAIKADMVFVDEAPGLWNQSTGAPL